MKSLNQSTLNPSLSFNKSSSNPLSKEIHETSYFSKDKKINNFLVLETSSLLEVSTSVESNNLLVSKNTENKRIVSRKKYS